MRVSGEIWLPPSARRRTKPSKRLPVMLTMSVPTGKARPKRCCSAVPITYRLAPPRALPAATYQIVNRASGITLVDFAVEACFSEKTGLVAADIGLRADSIRRPHVFHRAVVRHRIAVDLALVAGRRPADVVDLKIVVTAPEERSECEWLVRAQHVACGGLTLPLGNDPVLDADLAGARIRP